MASKAVKEAAQTGVKLAGTRIGSKKAIMVSKTVTEAPQTAVKFAQSASKIANMTTDLKESEMTTDITELKNWAYLPSYQKADKAFHEMGVSFASYLYYHGKEEMAKNICKDLKKYTKNFYSSSLVKAGELICNEDPYELGNIANFLQENLNVKNINPLWQGRLLQLLKEEKPEDALLLSADITYKTGKVYGAFYLFSDAFKRHDLVFSKKVFNMVEKIHGRPSAILDMAFAMLAEGSKELQTAGLQLLNSKNLEVTGSKLMFVINHGLENDKYGAVNTILVKLLETTTDFNALEHTIKVYFRKGLLTQISELNTAIKDADIAVPLNIRNFLDQVSLQVVAQSPSIGEQNAV